MLRRAEQESIAAIRSINPEAAERHDIMAHAYSVQAVTMLGRMEGGCHPVEPRWTTLFLRRNK